MDKAGPSNIKEKAIAEAAARRKREADALRENLRRRKQQARAREAADEPKTG